MRSTRSILFAMVLVALVTAACSSSNGDGGDSASETPTTSDATTYVDGVCTALTDWQSGLDSDNQTLQGALSDGKPTPEETKTALVDFLSATVDGTKTMVSDIEGLGTPEIDNGDQVASTLSSALGDVVTLFEGALDNVESLSTDDPQAMASALTDIGADITQGSTGIGTALGDLDTPELEDAAKDSTACQALSA
jgi:predicted small secreted protein